MAGGSPQPTLRTGTMLAPSEFATKMVDSGVDKVLLSTRDTLIRAYMAGALLALGAVFAVSVTVHTGNQLAGALAFPVGYCVLFLMGFDLLTGVFTMVPIAYLDKRAGVTLFSMLRNWTLVFLGNLGGALTVAFLIAFIFTFGFTEKPTDVGLKIGHIGELRTKGYEAHGIAGFLTLFIRAMLCNWMVSSGVVGAMMSTSLEGKVLAMYLPITLFFYMGFEHSVVNMFLFPSGLLLGGNFTIKDYLLWNELPTAAGNLVGGLAFVGLTLYSTHVRTGAMRTVEDFVPTPTPAQPKVKRGEVGEML